MTLQQLKYVVEVAERGSITEAAKSLFIAQPSLSAAIRDLEEETGTTIFLRNSRGILLTQEGVEFLGYARQVVQQAALIQRTREKQRRHAAARKPFFGYPFELFSECQTIRRTKQHFLQRTDALPCVLQRFPGDLGNIQCRAFCRDSGYRLRQSFCLREQNGERAFILSHQHYAGVRLFAKYPIHPCQNILRIRRAEGRKPAVAVSMRIQIRHKHAITRQRQFTGDVQHLAAVRSRAAVKENRPRRVRIAGQRREYLTAEHAAFRADGDILR